MRATILHVITGLEQGGAERSLFNLVTRSDVGRFRHIVSPMRDGGFWRAELLRAGVEIAPLHWNTALDSLAGIARLSNLIRRERPHVVQSWLYHADLAALLAIPFAGRTRLIWTLRNSDPRASGRGSWRVLLGMLAVGSRRPDLIVANSERAMDDHRVLGYRPRAVAIVPNGVDTQTFAPGDRRAARAKLGLPDDRFLIGMAARRDRFKDHENFLSAARLARKAGYRGGFVLAGAGTEALGGDGVMGLGPVAEMPTFYTALDLATLSSSHGEGFPNAIVEAMACGIPVVATEVGDVGRILACGGGAIVAARDPAALAQAWLDMAAESDAARARIGAMGRARVCGDYSAEKMAQKFEAIYLGLISNK